MVSATHIIKLARSAPYFSVLTFHFSVKKQDRPQKVGLAYNRKAKILLLVVVLLWELELGEASVYKDIVPSKALLHI